MTTCRRCHRLKKTCSTPVALSKGPAKRLQARPTRTVLQQPTPEPTPAPGLCGQQISRELKHHISDSLQELSIELKQELFDEFLIGMRPSYAFLTLETEFEKDAQTYSSAPDESLSSFTECNSRTPFTAAAILLVSLHRRISLQKSVAAEWLASVSKALIIDGHKSFDLLQSILLVTTYYPYHMLRSPQLHTLIHLAQSLAVDLNLANYTSHIGMPSRIRSDIGAALFGVVHGRSSAIAEHRATLGLYYLQAMYAITLRRLEFPRWSTRLDYACEYIQQHGNDSSDIHAVGILQALKVASVYLVPDGIHPSDSLPIRAYVRCFTTDMSRFRQMLPPRLKDDCVFAQELLTIEIALYDLAIAALESTPHTSGETYEAISATHNCLIAFVDKLLAYPLESYALMNSITLGSELSQMFEVFMKLHRIGNLDSNSHNAEQSPPIWTMADVPPSQQFSAVADRIAERLGDVFLDERARFPTVDCYRFAVYPIQVRQFKKKFDEQFATAGNAARGQQVAAQTDPVMNRSLQDMSKSMPELQMQDGGMFTSPLPALDDLLQWGYIGEGTGWP
ncbi:uncharacterized protein AB675_10953 [Cyphellophora attinorum]|uniref:Transcription factor domain-containing protein n=1 Tax=Cyphellophora attinorum TaxID=1664694 RepID=A0A0N0NIJ4_9EURO|nr:uncharacterized protein AB675_10953 [Phialophora attinorum]KPI35509.1 hypothetical protein AB675_10953 [Phialophora attinorum]